MKSALVPLMVLLSIAAPVFAQTVERVTVSMRPYKGSRSIVPVMLNGTGPYDLLVDTGATVTVLDADLFAELGLPAAGGSSQVASSTGVTSQAHSIVKEITLQGLSVKDLSVVSMQSPFPGSRYRGPRGILGENFLRHFDILFDNQHRTMILDRVHGLADVLTGEHLAIIFPPPELEDQRWYRPIISARLEDFGDARLLLDSGAEMFVLATRVNVIRSTGDTRITTVNGSMECQSTKRNVRLGRNMVTDLPSVTCQSLILQRIDNDGTLPTSIFKRIFISHAGSYAIVNPRGLD